jgi:hypothetical protein
MRHAQLPAVAEQRGLGRQWCLAVQQQDLGGCPVRVRFARVGELVQEVAADVPVQLGVRRRRAVRQLRLEQLPYDVVHEQTEGSPPDVRP